MFRKIILTLALALSLFGSFSVLCPTPALAETAPSDSVKSSEFRFDLGAITHPEIKKSKWIDQGIGYFLTRVIIVLAALAGSVAVAFMVWGGFLMILSAGNEEQYRKGIGYMKGAVIGLGFVFGAYILVTAIQLLISGIYG